MDPTADDPYEGVDVCRLPQWWKDCLSEFEAHDLYTYVPAYFDDDTVVHSVVTDLESRFGVEIKLLRVGGEAGADWSVEVDGERVGTVPRTRLRYGISIVDIDSSEFEELIVSAVTDPE